MTKNVSVSWVLPTTRQQGAALPVGEIAHTLVEMSADAGANFTELNQIVPTDPQTVAVPDLEVGDWLFRLTVVDTLGQAGTAHTETVTVVDDSPPDTVTDVTVTQT